MGLHEVVGFDILLSTYVKLNHYAENFFWVPQMNFKEKLQYPLQLLLIN